MIRSAYRDDNGIIYGVIHCRGGWAIAEYHNRKWRPLVGRYDAADNAQEALDMLADVIRLSIDDDNPNGGRIKKFLEVCQMSKEELCYGLNGEQIVALMHILRG